MTEKQIEEIEVVNNDGTPYIPKWYSKLNDWCFDHVPLYGFVYRVWKEYLCPSAIIRTVRFFFQRRFRGFDDSETWNLENTFYKWVYPRLKRFAEVSITYPLNYDEHKKWIDELNKRVEQVKKLINANEYEFDDWSYISKKEMNKIKTKPKHVINTVAYEYCVKDFNKWFAENITNLWW